jgi:TonB family protein
MKRLVVALFLTGCGPVLCSFIAEGVSTMRSSVTACGDRIAVTGTVKLHVKVDGDGTVSQVTVNISPDRRLGACVAEAMQLATFAPTRNRGTFTYPFTF